MIYRPGGNKPDDGKKVNVKKIAAREDIENLAFEHWKYIANEKAYRNKLITKQMYEYARGELLKSIDSLSKMCYDIG